MASGRKAAVPPNPESSTVRSPGHSGFGAGQICLYGWDSRSGICHGPNYLGQGSAADKRLLRALRPVSGSSWYGPIRWGSRREMAARFFALVHDLSDCGVAVIYCDESKMGPAEIVAVIPANRRSRLREE